MRAYSCKHSIFEKKVFAAVHLQNKAKKHKKASFFTFKKNIQWTRSPNTKQKPRITTQKGYIWIKAIFFCWKDLFWATSTSCFMKYVQITMLETLWSKILSLPPCAFLKELTIQKLIFNQYERKPNLLGNFLISELHSITHQTGHLEIKLYAKRLLSKQR